MALRGRLDVHVLPDRRNGTGKTQLARVIHENGPRAHHPFVALNCATLPETLIESELFGAHAGAHSTATRKIEGKVESAERGTLFLDEISELSHAAQAKLLHLLQSKEYYPLGSTKAQRANVRVIAATNVDLQRAVTDRQFRVDLVPVTGAADTRAPLAERGATPRSLLCARVRNAPPGARAVPERERPSRRNGPNVRQLENAAAVTRAASRVTPSSRLRHVRDGGSGHVQESTRRSGRQLRDPRSKLNVNEVAAGSISRVRTSTT
jgi:Nif-specific regulatory protein